MFGEGNLDEQQARANDYLGRAAALGNPVAQTLHAQQLFSGLNGEMKNESEYYRWITKAIEQGVPEAIVTHVENMLRVNRPIEPDIKSRLEQLAVRWNVARELLERVNSGERC